MLWRLECRENSKAIKHPAVYSDITHLLGNHIHLKKNKKLNALFRINFNILSDCRSTFATE